jgi:hypothetical protein
MPLPIRDGNQSLTTLSTIVVGNAHIPAHTVVSLGSQAITDIATAVSGVELGPNTISALENISVTFGVGTSITIGNVVSVTGGLTDAELRASSVTIGGSVSVSNFPATQAVTFGQASVTFGISTITGSVSVLNLPATQSVTFTQASVTFGQAGVTFGTAVITGSTSIIGTPSVTFGQAVVSASNIGNLNDSVGTDGGTPASTKFIKIGGHQDGQNQVEHIVHVSAGGAMKVDASDSSVTFGAIRGTVTVGNSITISSLPAISGTVTANILGKAWEEGTILIPDIKAHGMTGVGSFTVVGPNYENPENNPPIHIMGAVTIGSALPAGTNQIGVVTIGGGTVTIGAGTAQIGSVTASISGTVPISISSVTVGNSVTIGSLPAISGTVTVGNTVTIAGTVTANVFGYSDNETSYQPIPVVPWDEGVSGGRAVVVKVEQTGVGAIPVSGTVTANVADPSNVIPSGVEAGIQAYASDLANDPLPISGTVTANAVGYDYANQVELRIPVSDSSGSVLASIVDFNGSVIVPISGTVTANVSIFDPQNSGTNIAFSEDQGVVPNYGLQVGFVESGGDYKLAGSLSPFPISGTVTANVFGQNANNVGVNVQIPVIAFDEEISSAGVAYVVPVQISNADGTIGSNNSLQISGTVTANNLSQDIYDAGNDWRLTRSAIHLSIGGGEWQEVGGSNGAENPLPISGTVTVGAVPNGSLTTRFDSTTTANSAQLSSAVTNSNRKYLLIQNVTTSANIVTIGIGFSPTTTQGIQLSAGAGITFESSYIPTGAVYFLSSVTASPITIIEA